MKLALPISNPLVAHSPFRQQARRDPQLPLDLPGSFLTLLQQSQGFQFEGFCILAIVSFCHYSAPDLVYFASFLVSTNSGQAQSTLPMKGVTLFISTIFGFQMFQSTLPMKGVTGQTHFWSLAT